MSTPYFVNNISFSRTNLCRFRAIDVQCDRVLMEMKCQRTYYRCFIDIWHIEMLWMDYRIWCHIHGDSHLFAIQKEWKFMLERWEINHEQRLDGNLKFTPWPKWTWWWGWKRGQIEKMKKKCFFLKSLAFQFRISGVVTWCGAMISQNHPL